MATNSQVAHAWANKTGKHCRGSNFFYEDDTIYSYGGHFPIARHIDGVVLFTTESYSNSTSKHIGHTSNACRHLTVFRVVDVTAARTSSSKLGWLQGHKWNVQDYLRRIDEQYASASRSIKRGEWNYSYADDLVTELKAYAKHFKLGRTFVESHIPSAEIREKVMARCNANNAQENERYREQMARAKAQRAVRDEANREQMERWTRWDGRGLQARKVGDFLLNKINGEGITVGCHKIGWEEIDRLAEVEGWQGV